MSRTYRRAYTGAKAVTSGCRCHGGCDYCEANRKYSSRKAKQSADEQLENYYHTDEEGDLNHA